jgi:membrane dipeptidase
MITIDGHCDLLSFLLTEGLDQFYKEDPKINKKSWHLGGPELLVTAIYVSERFIPHQKEAKALQMAGIFWQLVEKKEFIPVLRKQDLSQPGKKALLAIEGGEPLNSIEDLYAFYRLGVRMLSFTWNYQNHLATGCMEDYLGGFTQKGKEIAKEAQNLGFIFDVSHLSEGSFWDLCKGTNSPLIASHSNVYTLCNHKRNLKDEQIKAIAEKKGVVGINFCSEFLEEANIQAVVRHISYIAGKFGVDYVGIGSDFLGFSKLTKGLENISKWLSLDEALQKEGFNKTEREKVLGGNFQRVFDKAL